MKNSTILVVDDEKDLLTAVKIMLLHKGNISVESIPDKGTVFNLKFQNHNFSNIPIR